MSVDILNPIIESEDQESLKRWRSEFCLDYKSFMVWQEKKKEWESFYDGNQLSADEKQALAKRGQPEVVINLIKPRIDSVIGDLLGRRAMMRARDKGSLDFEVAKHITEALRYVEEQNQFDESESRAAEGLLIGGQSWYKIGLEFDFLEPEIKISYRNNNDVILDRRCKRRDLKDAKRLWETVWVEQEDLIELYPDFEKEIKQAMAVDFNTFDGLTTGHDKEWVGDDYAHSDNYQPSADTYDLETFIDTKRRRIRLVNVWERVQTRIEFAFHPALENSVADLSKYTKKEKSDFAVIYPQAQYFARYKWELNSGIFISNQILEYKKNVRPHDSEGKFPFARAVASVEHETNTPYGMVKQYIDPQKEYNKRRSKLLHKTNTNRILADVGAVEDVERARTEAARPDGFILKNPGKDFQIANAEMNQSDVFMLQLSQQEVQASGVSKEQTGQENTDLSGRAIELRQKSGDKIIRPYFAALRSARRNAFLIVLEEIQQYWTSQKLVKITDDPNAQGIILNQKIQDKVTGQVFIKNDLKLGKYDIKIDEDVETPNQRSENFQLLAQLSPAILQSGQPFPIEQLIMASNLPGKLELVQGIVTEKQRQLQIAQAQAQIAQAQAVMSVGAAQKNGQNVTPTEKG